MSCKVIPWPETLRILSWCSWGTLSTLACIPRAKSCRPSRASGLKDQCVTGIGHYRPTNTASVVGRIPVSPAFQSDRITLHITHARRRDWELSASTEKQKIKCLMDFCALGWSTLTGSVCALNVKSLWHTGAESGRAFMDLSSQAPISVCRTCLHWDFQRLVAWPKFVQWLIEAVRSTSQMQTAPLLDFEALHHTFYQNSLAFLLLRWAFFNVSFSLASEPMF